MSMMIRGHTLKVASAQRSLISLLATTMNHQPLSSSSYSTVVTSTATTLSSSSSSIQSPPSSSSSSQQNQRNRSRYNHHHQHTQRKKNVSGQQQQQQQQQQHNYVKKTYKPHTTTTTTHHNNSNRRRVTSLDHIEIPVMSQQDPLGSALLRYKKLLQPMIDSQPASPYHHQQQQHNRTTPSSPTSSPPPPTLSPLIDSSHVISSILPVYYTMSREQKYQEYESMCQMIESHFYLLLKSYQCPSLAHDLYYMAIRDFAIQPSSHMTDHMIQIMINDPMGTVSAASSAASASSLSSSLSSPPLMSDASLTYISSSMSGQRSATLNLQHLHHLHQQRRHERRMMNSNRNKNDDEYDDDYDDDDDDYFQLSHQATKASPSTATTSHSHHYLSLGKRLKLFYKFSDSHRVPLTAQQYITLSNYMSDDGVVYLYERVANRTTTTTHTTTTTNHDTSTTNTSTTNTNSVVMSSDVAHIPPMTSKFLLSIIQRYKKLRYLHRKLLLVFEQAKNQFSHLLTPEIYDSMVEHYCQIRGVNVAEELIRELRERFAFEPTIYTYTHLLRGYQSIHNVPACRQVLNRVLEQRERQLVAMREQQASTTNSNNNNHNHNNSNNHVMMNSVIQLDDHFMACYIYTLGYHGLTREAHQVLNTMQDKYGVKPNFYCYRILVTMYLNHNEYDMARSLLDTMTQQGMKSDVFIYKSLIKQRCKQGQIQEAMDILDQVIKSGHYSPITAGTTNANASTTHNKSGKKVGSSGSREMISGQNHALQFSSLFTEMVVECVKMGQLNNALQLTNRMERLGVRPTAKHVYHLISGFVTQYEQDQRLLSLPPNERLEGEDLKDLLHPQLLHYHQQLQQQKMEMQQQQHQQHQKLGESHDDDDDDGDDGDESNARVGTTTHHNSSNNKNKNSSGIASNNKQLNSLELAQEFLLSMTSKYGHSVVSASTLNHLLSVSSKYNGIEKTEEMAKSILQSSNEELNTRVLIALIRQYAEYAPANILPIFSEKVLASLHSFKQRFDFKNLYFSTLKILLDHEKYWVALKVFETLTVLPALSQLIHKVVVDCEPQRRPRELREQVNSILSTATTSSNSSNSTTSTATTTNPTTTNTPHSDNNKHSRLFEVDPSKSSSSTTARSNLFDSSGDVQVYRQAPTILSYNHMLSCLAALEKYEELIEAFKLMEPYQLTPNFNTFYLLIKALVAANLFETARNVILVQMKQLGIPRPPLIYNMLLRGYDVEFAQVVLQDMATDNISPGVNTHQLLMETYFLNNMPEKVVETYEQLTERTHLKPQPYIYSIVLRSLCKMKQMKKAMQFLEDHKSVWHNYRYYSQGSQYSEFPQLEEDLMYTMIDGLCLTQNIQLAQQMLDSYFESRLKDGWEKRLSTTSTVKSDRLKMYIPLIKYHLQTSKDFRSAELLLHDIEKRLAMAIPRYVILIMIEGAKELGLNDKVEFYERLLMSSSHHHMNHHQQQQHVGVGGASMMDHQHAAMLIKGGSSGSKRIRSLANAKYYESVRKLSSLLFRAEREPGLKDRDLFERNQDELFARENSSDDQMIQLQNQKRIAAYNAVLNAQQQHEKE